jgi:uncharacterized protein with PQ loop repeat
MDASSVLGLLGTAIALVSFAWAVYGLWTGQPFVTLATGASGIVFVLIAVYALRFGRTVSELRIAPLWLLVIVAAASLWGAQGLGVVLPVSILVSNLPQVRLAWREASLADLSLGTWLLSFADGLVWGLYALLEGDRSIMVFGALQMATSAAIVAAKLFRRSGRRAEETGGP